MDLSDPFFCISVLIVYIFIKRWMWVIVFLNLLYVSKFLLFLLI